MTAKEEEEAEQAEFNRNADEAASVLGWGCLEGCLAMPAAVCLLFLPMFLIGR